MDLLLLLFLAATRVFMSRGELVADVGVADALDRLGDRLVQQCEEGGLASRVANLEERINQLHMQLASFNISRQGRSLEDSSGDVHFSAQSSKKLCCNRCILKYDKMQVNSGSGLIPEEGIFKAPKEGNYYFQFHGLVGPGHEARVQLELNSAPVLHIYDRDYSQGRTVADRFSMFGQSVIVQMSAGDQFRVMLVRGCLGVDGGQYLSFLGHRLAPSLP